MSRLLAFAALLALAMASLIPLPPKLQAAEPVISWKKTVLDEAFRSEGVAIADVNKDGKIDVLNGEYWYEAPKWTPHEMQPPKDWGNGLGNYSRVFCCWAEDINGDGYPDLIVIAFPGEPCYWLENPKGKATTEDGKPLHWKKHIIWHSACNETPQYSDLFGNGKRVLIMGFQPKGTFYRLTEPVVAAIQKEKTPVPAEVLKKLAYLDDKEFTREEMVSELAKRLSAEEIKNYQETILKFAGREKGSEGQMAYFTPGSNPTALWEMHPISEPSTPPNFKDGKPVPGTGKEIPGTQRFSHGLGVGDINGDGRKDVMCTGGWWEQPEKPDGKTPWKFHPANLGEPCADMFAYDMDGDGKADVISTSAHKFGIWWHKQRDTDKNGNPTFQKMDLFPKLVSETHAAHFVDIDGDGRPDLITGKRWWSHGKSEPGSDGPAAIYWFKNTKGPDGIAQFTPMLIDNDSGIGTQFVVADINGDGLLDIITSNKKGVRVIVQERK